MAVKKTVFTPDVFFEDGFGTHVIQSQYNPHEHSYFEITYVLEGTAKHCTPKGEEELTKSSFYLLRPKDVHTYVDFGFNNVFHRDIICHCELFENICNFIHPKLFEHILAQEEYIKLPLFNENFYIVERLINQYAAVPPEDKELRYAYIKSIILQFVSIYVNQKFNSHGDEDNLYAQLLKALHNPSVLQGGIDALVQALNFSHGHICRLIKQHTDHTLIELLTAARIEYAAQLLKALDVPINDIAYSVGYESASHFIQLFRQQMGVTPFQYRKQFQTDSNKK
jgi:AraC-like DNA-binding protein